MTELVEEVAREARIAEFGMVVVLDTDLRKLHEQGRTSDALRLIQWAFDRQRNEGIEAAAALVQRDYPHDKRVLVPAIRALKEPE